MREGPDALVCLDMSGRRLKRFPWNTSRIRCERPQQTSRDGPQVQAAMRRKAAGESDNQAILGRVPRFLACPALTWAEQVREPWQSLRLLRLPEHDIRSRRGFPRCLHCEVWRA